MCSNEKSCYPTPSDPQCGVYPEPECNNEVNLNPKKDSNLSFEVTIAVDEPECEVVSQTTVLKYNFPIGYSESGAGLDGHCCNSSGGGSSLTVTVVEQMVTSGHPFIPSTPFRQIVHIDYQNIYQKYADEVFELLWPKLEGLDADWTMYLASITKADDDAPSNSWGRRLDLRDALKNQMQKLHHKCMESERTRIRNKWNKNKMA